MINLNEKTKNWFYGLGVALVLLIGLASFSTKAPAQDDVCYTHEMVVEVNEEQGSPLVYSLSPDEVEIFKQNLQKESPTYAFSFSGVDLFVSPMGSDFIFVVLYDENGCGIKGVHDSLENFNRLSELNIEVSE